MQKINQFLFKPVNSQLLGLFRIFFGLCLIYELFYYMQIDLLNHGLRQPVMLFPYRGLEWIHLLPGKGMEILIFLLFISAICITVGYMLRLASTMFFAGFAWIFFLDKGLYNNHLYLFLLITFLFIITDADASFSIAKKKSKPVLPAWQLMLFQFQIIVVYFYGGIAKLNTDWLFHFQPALAILDETKSTFAIYILVYGGLLFDLFIGFLLLWSRTRIAAMVFALIFNITNAIIFDDIGVFPFFMIGALMLFADPAIPGKLFGNAATDLKKSKVAKTSFQPKNSLVFLLGIYIMFQLLFPFRYMLYRDYRKYGHIDWYGEAQRFSWRMKIQYREMKEFKVKILNYRTKEILNVEPVKYLTDAQLYALKNDPQMLLAFVKFIEKDAKLNGIADPFIKASCIVTFNGRPPQPIVDPEKNLCTIDQKDPVFTWVLPLKNQ